MAPWGWFFIGVFALGVLWMVYQTGYLKGIHNERREWIDWLKRSEGNTDAS